MLKLLDTSVELLLAKHKNGETYYWILYYTFLSSRLLRNVEDVVEQLRPHIKDINFPTYCQIRRKVIDVLSSILSGYTSRNNIAILEYFPKTNEY